MHPWRGRSRPPQSNLPLKDPESAVAERHPQLVACETFLEHPLRALEGEAGDVTLRPESWARAWQQALEEWAPLSQRRSEAEDLIFAGHVWHLELGPGEIAGVVRDERLVAARITLPGLGTAAEGALVEALEGKVESVDDLLSGDVSHEVRTTLLDPDQGLLPPLERARWRCQCGQRKLCPHVAALLLAATARFAKKPGHLFRLRKTSPDVLRGLLPDAVNAPLPAGVTELDPAEVARVFDLRLYIPKPLPEPPEETLAAEDAPEPAASDDGGSWLDDDWDEEDDDDSVFGGPMPVELRVAPPPAPGPSAGEPAPARSEGSAARPEASAAAPIEDLPDISRADLLDLGIPSHRIQRMLSDGRLIRTDKRGRYQLTAEAWEEIEPLLPED